jgi:hypothetical protein
MTHACPAWEFAADAHLIKTSAPAKQDSPHSDKFPKSTPIRDMHMAVRDSSHIMIIVFMRVNHFIYTIYTHSLTHW